jgi:hypothetical protein
MEYLSIVFMAIPWHPGFPTKRGESMASSYHDYREKNIRDYALKLIRWTFLV